MVSRQYSQVAWHRWDAHRSRLRYQTVKEVLVPALLIGLQLFYSFLLPHELRGLAKLRFLDACQSKLAAFSAGLRCTQYEQVNVWMVHTPRFTERTTRPMVPETKTIPRALTAWLQAPTAAT